MEKKTTNETQNNSIDLSDDRTYNYNALLKAIAKSNNNGAPADIVYVEKAKTELVVAFSKVEDNIRAYKIALLDQKNVLSPVSFIEYQIKDNGIYIATFKTRYDYQGTGLGKYIYQLVQAHADKLGLTHSEGLIWPIANIKAVDGDSYHDFDKQYRFLQLMYHALGNKIVKVSTKKLRGQEDLDEQIYDFSEDSNTNNDDDQFSMLQFKDDWKMGDKYKKLNPEQKKFIDKVTKFELKLHNKYLLETQELMKNR